MKTTKALLTLIVLITLGLSTFAQQYAVKSGYIKYELTGSTMGTKEIWWDNYGVNSYTEVKSVTVTKMFGMKTEDKQHQITVHKGENYWSANLIDGDGQKGKNPYYQMGKDFADGLSEAEKKQLEEQVKQSLNAQELGTETFLGRTCDVMSVMGAKSWIYKGVILKSDAKVMGIQNVETAVKFDEEINVPASKFTPYEGVEYQDLQALQAEYYGQQGMDYDDEEEDETPKVPVKYPYGKFESTINGFSQSGYTKAMCSTVDGQHMAMFMQGMGKSLTIVASSKQNDTGDREGLIEEFNHNGHKCMYANLDGDDGTALIIDYPAYDMYLVIGAMPEMSKDELVKISDKMKF